MKILVVSHTYIVDLNREKFRALAKLEPGIEVTIVVPRRWQPGGVQNQIIETQPIQEGSFQVVTLSNFSQNNQGLLLFGWDLIKLLRELRPDIIQVEQGSKALAYAEIITLNRLLGIGAKNLFFTWWNLPYDLKWPISWLEAYNLRATDGVVVGNQDGADILRDRGFSGPMVVMPQLGVDETLFKPEKQPKLAAKLGINEEDFIVGFVGRFVEEKGLMTLATALENLREHPWQWLLLGRGELHDNLLDWAAEHQLHERLIVVESVPHEKVHQYINLMDVLVLPSETTYKFKTLTSVGWKEQFGHVLIEAMACQVPVIGSDSGEIPYVIDSAGLVFPEKDVESLQDCLTKLMDNSELAQDLGKKGYQRAIAHYTNKALAKELLAFYKKILQPQ